MTVPHCLVDKEDKIEALRELPYTWFVTMDAIDGNQSFFLAVRCSPITKDVVITQTVQGINSTLGTDFKIGAVFDCDLVVPIPAPLSPRTQPLCQYDWVDRAYAAYRRFLNLIFRR
jgi:hypothetical protein